MELYYRKKWRRAEGCRAHDHDPPWGLKYKEQSPHRIAKLFEFLTPTWTSSLLPRTHLLMLFSTVSFLSTLWIDHTRCAMVYPPPVASSRRRSPLDHPVIRHLLLCKTFSSSIIWMSMSLWEEYNSIFRQKFELAGRCEFCGGRYQDLCVL